MGVKYTIPFKSDDDTSWRVDIALSTYNEEPIAVRGVAGQAAVLTWESEEVDSPYSPFVKSALSISLYNEGRVDVRELQRATDKQFLVTLYRSNALYWTGYLDSEGLQQSFRQTPYAVQLTAKDGLGMLADIPYTHAELFGTGNTVSHCLLNYIRQILLAPVNLGLQLPIRWVNHLECTAFLGQDVLTTAQWSTLGEGYYSAVDGQYKSCEYILKGLIQSMQCRIYQDNGKWNICRVNDTVTGYVNYKQIPADLGQIVISTGTENMTHRIGRNAYRILEDTEAIIINRPGLKAVKATYDANVNENILPNGDFDYTELFFNTTTLSYEQRPIHWNTPVGQTLNIQVVPPLDARNGNAVKLTYTSGTIPEYGIVKPLPLNGRTLVARINFSFLFSPVVWEVNATTGFVDFVDMPLQVRVRYKIGATTYWLNQYGYWINTPVLIDISVDGMLLGEVASVKFDKFQGIILPAPETQPHPGDICELDVAFRFSRPRLNPQSFILDNVSITTDENFDVYESVNRTTDNTLTEDVTLPISSSFGGYMVSNIMSSYDRSDDEFQYNDGDYYTGSLTGLTANAMMRFRYAPSLIFTGSFYVGKKDYNFDQIYVIDSFSDTRFMPLRSTYNIEKCEVNINAMECRNDNVIFTEKFYGSNNKILSN